MKTSIIIKLLILLFTTNLFSQSQWDLSPLEYTGNNQKSGNISFIDADIGYANAFTINNGIWNNIQIHKTTNKGQNWFKKYDWGPNFHSAGWPVIAFVNQNTGFSVTLYSSYTIEIQKTTDDCLTWSLPYSIDVQHNGCESFPTPVIKFIDNNTGYLSTLYSICKTTNCGQNWTEVLSWDESPGNQFLIIDFETSKINSNIIYAVGGWYGINGQYTIPKIKKSTNSGNTWVVMLQMEMDI